MQLVTNFCKHIYCTADSDMNSTLCYLEKNAQMQLITNHIQIPKQSSFVTIISNMNSKVRKSRELDFSLPCAKCAEEQKQSKKTHSSATLTLWNSIVLLWAEYTRGISTIAVLEMVNLPRKKRRCKNSQNGLSIVPAPEVEYRKWSLKMICTRRIQGK